MSIDTLKSFVSRDGGYARSNRFAVSFAAPGIAASSEYITYMCESVSIPGKQITSFEYPFQALANAVKVPNGYTFDDVTCIFNLTHSYEMKKTFDTWMSNIITPNYLLNYTNSYETTVLIEQLNTYNQAIYGIELRNAYPITMQAIDLSNATTDEISKLSVTFTFTDAVPV